MSIYETIYKVLVATPAATGELQPAVKDVVRSTPSQNRQILLAYPPKVGGTFMRTALIKLLHGNYQSYLSRGSYANTDQSRDLHFPTILNQHIIQTQPPGAAVMHLHMYPSRHVTDIMETFDIPVVIATRDILDTLLSGVNMTEGMEENKDFIDDAIVSNGKPYYDMTAEERRHSVVNIVPVWYARFYAQWLRYDAHCRAEGKRPPLWLRYDDLVSEPENVLKRIAAHVDPKHSYTDEQIRNALETSLANKAAVRFNKGVPGRGHGYFTETEKRTIYDIVGKAGEETLREMGIINDLAFAGAMQARAG